MMRLMKRFFVACAAVAAAIASAQADDTLWGDANCDGQVDFTDPIAILQSIANEDKYALSPQGKINGDVDSV